MYSYRLYIDPGTGSMLISALIAALSVAFFAIKGNLYTLFSRKGEKGTQLDPNKHYGLVFYSEGKQYWNVFKPLLEEGSKRSIAAVYLTSDPEDPGLNAKLDSVQSIFIGTGRQAYFTLNRLNADIVVMTTPGLDVLDIRRSKKVRHYVHISHATGSFATYKSYATDYFDSVLIGGEGDVAVIRELETKRNLPHKQIEIIGHTYLDVLRESLRQAHYDQNYFDEKKTTVLVSPTWGNHGLLTKYGETLLTALEEAGQYNVIIRPHPQSFISEKEMIAELMAKFPNNKYRIWNTDRENIKAMHHADIMISDFSGIVFDFFTLFKKPIITIRSQFDKRGRDASDLQDEAWDLQFLDIIGRTLDGSDFSNLARIIDDTVIKFSRDLEELDEINLVMDKYPGEAAVRGINFLKIKLDELSHDIVDYLVTETSEACCFGDNYTLNPQNSVSGGITSRLLKLGKAFISPGFLFQTILMSCLLFTYVQIGIIIQSTHGLTHNYLTQLKPYLMILIITLMCALIGSIWFFGKGRFDYFKRREPFTSSDILISALPMTPIVQYIFANQDILKFTDSIIVFVIFSLLAFIITVGIPWILSPLVARVFTMPVSTAFAFITFNMASFGRTTRGRTITLIMIGIVLLSFLLNFMNKKKLLLILALVFFAANSIAAINQFVGSNTRVMKSTEYAESNIFKLTEDKEIQNFPDVFIMVYDSYANQETLNAYGFDNSEQMDYLLEQGFAIYDGTYSLGHSSLISMSQVLHTSLLPELGLVEYRRLVAGDASGLSFFRDNGYILHFIADDDYLFKGIKPNYDTIFPPLTYSIEPYKIISSAILEGEFRFDIDFSNVDYEDLLDAKKTILSQNLSSPEFLYHHIYSPGHSQNSGVLLSDETERHIEKILVTNQEMKNDILNMDLETREAFVVFLGDHGPYLTKNGVGLDGDYQISEVDRLDIQDRYGTFLAIHWPDPSYATRYEIQTIQDILPAVLSYMYEDDTLFEELKMSSIVEASPVLAGAGINDGIIVGGIDDGESLFENTGVRFHVKP